MKNIHKYTNSFRILEAGKISLVLSVLLASSTLINAAPSGGVVTSGDATIANIGKVTNITQSTQKASINWNQFSVASDEIVNFKQPDINSITLNRVVGNERSIIDGALNANGQVWILNSNGVLFGKGAKINTAGLLATTKELSDADFQAGNYNLKGNSTESVINLGEIDISNSGYANLLANSVSNEGTIKAVKGSVRLVGANEVTINLNGNSIIELTVNKGVLDALVENKGAVYVDAGEIYLTTNAVDELLKGVVNNTGVIEANSMDGLTGHVELFAHGGEVQVGGTLEAKDGFIETSGKDFKILENAIVKAGEWLIDPVDVTIDATLASTIVTALGSGDVTIKTDSPNTSTNVTVPAENQTSTDGDTTDGDIYVNSDITWSTDKKLTLNATDAIYVNAIIQNTNSTNGGVYFEAANTNDKVIFHATDGKVIIHNINQLQWMNTALNGKYELGSNIDASATSVWNVVSGVAKGWAPIGDLDSRFSGKFDGLGHTISNLKINDNTKDYVGFFGITNGATISNVGLVDVNILGGCNVGGLVGNNYGSSIINSYASGTVIGTVSGTQNNVGGLVGNNNGSSITNSYANGTVSGTGNFIGGLVGYNFNSPITNSYASGDVSGTNNGVGGLVGVNSTSSITNSYASGDVSGADFVGGLVGDNTTSSITNSYASGTVSGTNYVGGLVSYSFDSSITNSYASGTVSGTNNVGGLVGKNYENSSITDSFYDSTNIINNTNAINNIGKTKAEIVTEFSSMASSPWTTSGSGAAVAGYELLLLPYLTDVTRTADISKVTLFNSGLGTSATPYTITNWTQLQNINNSNILTHDKYFALSDNLSSTTSDYTTLASNTANTNTGWNPIGNTTSQFKGTFDGSGKTISNLNIDDNTKDYVGLFGYVTDATIKNLGLIDVDIKGGDLVGGLVGKSSHYSSIKNSYTSGAVSGADGVGGLVGQSNQHSLIENSYASGTVSGADNVGGLVGVNLLSSSITNSFYDKTKNSTGMSDATLSGVTGLSTNEMSYGQIFKTAGWDIVPDSTVTSTTPIIKYDSANSKYVWAIKPLDLHYTLSDKSKIYNGVTENLSDLYTDVFGVDYSFITSGYKFQRSASDVTSYKNAGTYDGIKVVSDGTNDFLTIKEVGSTDGKYVINKKALTVSGLSSANKVYDATTTATKTGTATLATSIAAGTGTSSDGKAYTGDTISVVDTALQANFNSKDVATASTVSFTGLVLDGAQKDNYVLASHASASHSITKKDITAVTGITAANKTYDGTTNATLDKLAASFNGKINGDTLTVATATGAFDNKNVGTGKTVNITGLTLGGADVGNYTLTSTTSTTTANITAAPTLPTPAEDKVPEKIIRAAENSVTPPIFNLPNSNIPSTSNQGTGNSNSNLSVVSQPSSSQSYQSVSLGQLQQSQTDESGSQGTGDIRVPASANSQIILVNGGVKLPDGVEQEFYASANQNNESKEK